MRSFFGISPKEMCRFLLGGLSLVSGIAVAEEPVAAGDSALQPSVVTQSTTTTVTTTAPATAAAPAVPALPPPPAVAAQPPALVAPPAVFAPPPVYVAPPAPAAQPAFPAQQTTGVFQGPIYYNGPVWVIPAPMNGQPGVPPVYAPPPVYAQPPPVVAAPTPPAPVQPRYLPPIVPKYPALRYRATGLRKFDRGPVVGVGLRFSVLGVPSQQVFGKDVTLFGGGVFLRFRNQGRFGFETSLDILHTEIGNNSAYGRTSYPFSIAPMLYLFPNRPSHHFNIYALAGFGLMADSITLYKGSPQELNQQFWEVMGQAGGGIEVRLKRLALFADARAIALLLDDSSPAGAFYRDVEGGPIPAQSAGYKVHVGALFWF